MHHNLSSLALNAFSVCVLCERVPPVHYSVSKLAPLLSSCHTFLLLEHFVDFVDAMQICVDFDHVSSCSSIFNAFDLSQYSWHFSSGISFVALRCTFSSILWSLLSAGAQITIPYSSIGLTRLEYSFFTVGPSKNVNDLLISPSILLALFAINSTCWSNFSSGSACTPKSLSFVVSPNIQSECGGALVGRTDVGNPLIRHSQPPQEALKRFVSE